MSRARANADATSQTYIENATAAQELSGTYSTERLYFNDSYQLTGDVTVTGHLALGTVADADVVITNDSTARTLTVDGGVIEAGGLLAEESKDLTGMTGELGNVVTGSPNLNLTTGLANANTQFPAGHIIEHQITSFPSAQYQSATTDVTHRSTDYITINHVPAGATLVAMFSGGYFEPTSGYGNTIGFQINGTDYPNLVQGGSLTNVYPNNVYTTGSPMSKSITFASSTNNVVVKIVLTRNGGSYMEYRLGGIHPAVMNVFITAG